jgi:hypothetical protein
MPQNFRIVYYNINNLIDYGGKAVVDFYDDPELEGKAGRAFFSNNSFVSRSVSISQELATFFFDFPVNSTISFLANSNTNDGTLREGEYTFNLMCGQGEYIFVEYPYYVVTFVVYPSGLRKLTFVLKSSDG